jgi:hypothetical protein
MKECSEGNATGGIKFLVSPVDWHPFQKKGHPARVVECLFLQRDWLLLGHLVLV